LSKILPADTLLVAEEVYRKQIASQPTSDDAAWGGEYCQLKFWYLVSDAFTSVESFDGIQREFAASAGSLLGGPGVVLNSLGRFKPKLRQAAAAAAAALEGAVRCEAGPYEEMFGLAGGARSVWRAGEKALVQELCARLDQAVSIAEEVSQGEEGEGGISELNALISQLLETAAVLFLTSTPDPTPGSTPGPGPAAACGLSETQRGLRLGLMDRFDACAVQDSVARLSLLQTHTQAQAHTQAHTQAQAQTRAVSEHLEAAHRIMQDIEQRRSVMAVVVGQLMKKWAKVR
jgi:hypothetical protein